MPECSGFEFSLDPKSLFAIARFHEPECQVLVDVVPDDVVEGEFALADCVDLLFGQPRKNEEVGDVDAELVTAPPTARV